MEGEAAIRLEQARQRALELISCYQEKKETGDNDDMVYNRGVYAQQLIGETVEESNTTSSGFNVINLKSDTLVDSMDKVRFESLQRFVENAPQKPAWACLRDFERKQRVKERKQAKALLQALASKDGVSLPQQPPSGKDFVKLNRENAATMKQTKKRQRRKRAIKPLAIEDKHPIPGLESPRNSPPTILDPGFRTQVAWNGVPNTLRRMYFPSDDEREDHGESDKSPHKGHEIHDNRMNAQSPVEDQTQQWESKEEQRKRALEFVKNYNNEEKHIDTSVAGRTKEQQRREWLKQKALRHRKGEKPEHVDHQPKPKVENNQEDRGQQGRHPHRRQSYSELCRKARDQVLAERAELLEDMERRRKAAEVLQRALRRHIRKIQNKQDMDLKKAIEMQKRLENATRLQKVFRGHKARVAVSQTIQMQADAARKVQRMIRNSYNWKRLLKERLQIKQKKAVVQSVKDKEHYEWVQRVLARAEAEKDFQQLSKLGPTEDKVKDWIIFAPRVPSGWECVADESSHLPLSVTPENSDSHEMSPRQRTTLAVRNVPRLRLNEVDSSRTHAPQPPSSRRTISSRRRRQIMESPLSPSQEFSVKHWDSHRMYSMAENRILRNEEPGEYEAMNHLAARQLAETLTDFKGRTRELRKTMVTFVNGEGNVPALHFVENDPLQST